MGIRGPRKYDKDKGGRSDNKLSGERQCEATVIHFGLSSRSRVYLHFLPIIFDLTLVTLTR
jgi:hypothetical protein